MKKKKIKKMINKLKKKSERELDVEVDLINEKIRCTNERIDHIDERTTALDNIKVQRALDKTKELDSKIKILMDRTSTNYNACSDTGITFENTYQIIKFMADRGATQEELNILRDCFNRYIFRS